jgi:hypothetical protein
MHVYHREYFLGLDLGQRHDPSALAILESERIAFPQRDPVTAKPIERHRRVLRRLEKVPLHTPYPDVVARIKSVVDRLQPLSNRITVVVDATGVGAPVLDLLKTARLQAHLIPVTLTGAEWGRYGDHGYSVPRRDLLRCLHLALESGSVQICEGIPNRRDITRELREVDWRKSDTPDDLVIAAALATWRSTNPRW